MSTQQDAASSTVQGTLCWVEVNSADPIKLKEFYATIFPAWTFRATDVESASETLHYTFDQPSGLSGGIVKLPADCKPGEQPMGIGFTPYHLVKSIEEIEKTIIELGGRKVLDKKQESEHGWYANFKDPEGNRFGVYEYKSK